MPPSSEKKIFHRPRLMNILFALAMLPLAIAVFSLYITFVQPSARGAEVAEQLALSITPAGASPSTTSWKFPRMRNSQNVRWSMFTKEPQSDTPRLIRRSAVASVTIYVSLAAIRSALREPQCHLVSRSFRAGNSTCYQPGAARP